MGKIRMSYVRGCTHVHKRNINFTYTVTVPLFLRCHSKWLQMSLTMCSCYSIRTVLNPFDNVSDLFLIQTTNMVTFTSTCTPSGWSLNCSPCRFWRQTYKSSPHMRALTRGGGSPCRLSIVRNPNSVCPCHLVLPMRMKNSRYSIVACHYLIFFFSLSHVLDVACRL